MRAVVIESYGGPEVLAICEVPAPEPGPDEVLVDVVASALNRADLLQRMGLYPGPSMEYEVPGLEFAGRVAVVGEAVGRWLVGDEVMAITSGGAHAGQAVVHADQAMAVPAGMSLADAGALPEVFITAWDALVLQGGLQPRGTALAEVEETVELAGLVYAHDPMVRDIREDEGAVSPARPLAERDPFKQRFEFDRCGHRLLLCVGDSIPCAAGGKFQSASSTCRADGVVGRSMRAALRNRPQTTPRRVRMPGGRTWRTASFDALDRSVRVLEERRAVEFVSAQRPAIEIAKQFGVVLGAGLHHVALEF